jgi:type II secretion system protein I
MRHRHAESGFTLIEVLIALVMLALLSMALMSNSAKMIRSVTDDRARTIATASADERIARARVWPNYATLDNLAGTESNTPQTAWTRTTTVVRTGGSGQANDYKRVTVVVNGPGLPAAISRTITVAAP